MPAAHRAGLRAPRGPRRLPALAFCLSALALFAAANAQLAPPHLAPNLMSTNTLPYDMGSPVLRDIYCSPSGSEAADGASPSTPTTFARAWRDLVHRTGSNATRTTGYRVYLMPGTYPESQLPNYMENAVGTYQYPTVIQAVTPGTVTLNGDLNVFNCRYLYLLDFAIDVAGDCLHFEQCHYLLMRNLRANGRGAAHETLKANQCSMVFVESCQLSGSYENALDYVAVHSGHIINSKFFDADDWCAYLKGGSAYFRVHGNEFYNCGTGGFTAGQGTGFEYMVAPWLFYEAVDIKFTNNVIHDTVGACFGCNGCAYTLFAYNNCTRVGSRSHTLEFVPGSRSCDGDSAKCTANRALGGWGPPSGGWAGPNDGGEFVPNLNVYVVNNRIVNPAPFRSQWQHFAVRGPSTPVTGVTGVPNPALSDDGLVIRGNLVQNGGSDMPLGIGDGCPNSNPTCNEAQLLRDNAINAGETAVLVVPVPDFPAWTGGVMGLFQAGATSNAMVVPGGVPPPPPPPPPPATTARAVVPTTKKLVAATTKKRKTTTKRRKTTSRKMCTRATVVPCALKRRAWDDLEIPAATVTVREFVTVTETATPACRK
ncbi:pectin lyase fold/virulence factor [Hyaloraphidium curvatum]|nr:pectin lyase fold/virulence factor [Hyaloraphidium curvatum]